MTGVFECLFCGGLFSTVRELSDHRTSEHPQATRVPSSSGGRGWSPPHRGRRRR
jgi:hypothetical protein